jgi:signal transduction histidine kinase
VGRTLVSELEAETVLRRLLDAAREITGARYAALGVLSEDRKTLRRFLTVGIDEAAHREIGDLPRGRGVLGVLISEPKPLRLPHVGDHPRSYGFPANHPPMDSFLGVPVLIRGEPFGNLYLTNKEGGGEFTDDDEEAAVVLADWTAIAIDNARLFERESERRTELERAVRGLEATTTIARAMGGETDLERILELIVKRGRALVEARAMLILLEEGEELVVTAASGELDGDVLGLRVPVEGSVSGGVLQTGRAERLDNVSERLTAPLAEAIQAQTGLFVPLLFRGHALGVLATFDRLGTVPEFGSEDEQILLAFAASAATAVATAQQVAAKTLRGSIESAERERAHWARELHDETLQDLAALKVGLTAARRSGDPEKLNQAVDQAVDQVDEAVRELRSLITELRPASLDQLGVQPAVESLAERIGGLTDIEITLDIDLPYEEGPVSARHHPELESTVYRVVQESLNNVVKHAAATRAEVTIREDGTALELTVRDDGRGFDAQAPANGFGLVGMRERIRLLGGSLTIDSTPDKGTTVRATMPVRRATSSPYP